MYCALSVGSFVGKKKNRIMDTFIMHPCIIHTCTGSRIINMYTSHIPTYIRVHASELHIRASRKHVSCQGCKMLDIFIINTRIEVWIHASWIRASWICASWIHASWIHAPWIHVSWVHTSWIHVSWIHVSWIHASWTHLHGSHGLSARRAVRTKSRRPEGPQTRSWGPEGPLNF